MPAKIRYNCILFNFGGENAFLLGSEKDIFAKETIDFFPF
jgi:hypothetical protein